MNVIERNKLVENYLPLANKIAFENKKRLPKKVSLDDLKSAAYFGLLDAATKFNEKKSCSFATYARFRIVGEIKDFVRESYNHYARFGISLDEPDENGDTLEIPVFDKPEFFEEIICKLNDLDKNIFTKYYTESRSLKEIGTEVGLSESRISQILKQCRSYLQVA